MGSPAVHIIKDDAIVLRFYPVTNTSRMVVWFTRTHGKITTLIKGSQRPKSAFIGQYDVFYRCELLFYANHSNHVHHTKECSPLAFRSNLRTDWRASLAASYFVDLVLRVTEPGYPNPKLYDLLEQGLSGLDEHGMYIPVVHDFELQLLDLLGLTPQFSQCVGCDSALKAAEESTRFAVSKGGLFCNDCSDRDRVSGLKLSRVAVNTLKAWQRTNSSNMAMRTKVRPEEAKEIRFALGHFLRYHLDMTLESRRLMFDLLHRASSGATPAVA